MVASGTIGFISSTFCSKVEKSAYGFCLANKSSLGCYDAAGSTPTMAGMVTLFVPWIDTTVLALEGAAGLSAAMVVLLLSAAFAFRSPSFFCAPGFDASLLLDTATTA